MTCLRVAEWPAARPDAWRAGASEFDCSAAYWRPSPAAALRDAFDAFGRGLQRLRQRTCGRFGGLSQLVPRAGLPRTSPTPFHGRGNRTRARLPANAPAAAAIRLGTSGRSTT